MKKHEKYLEILKTFANHATVTEWTKKFDVCHSEEAEKADKAKLKAIKKKYIIINI